MKYQSGNWSRSNPLLGRFDVIIGSDVLYDRGQLQVLAQFTDQHAQPDVQVLIVDPDRGNRVSFNREWMRGAIRTAKPASPHCRARAASTRDDC
ncbi:MAG: hypothetical protein ABIR56_01355 [Polaromonas sp.]